MHKNEMTSRLVLFCPTNKNLCYEYVPDKTHQKYYCCSCAYRVTATVCQTQDTKDCYLILSKIEHYCNLREFDPEKYKDDIVVNKEMYKINLTAFKNSTCKIMAIFTSEEKKFYYRLNYSNQRKCYFCPKCFSSKIHITATIQNEGKENEFVYLSNQKHICEPMDFIFQDNQVVSKHYQVVSERIIMSPNFQLLKRKIFGKIS
uniref:Uncharacterized protein n=1 Tax=Panagrolaimus sp. ES5 TaxID=591445 RepID=A0AC34GSM7_9BILA